MLLTKEDVFDPKMGPVKGCKPITGGAPRVVVVVVVDMLLEVVVVVDVEIVVVVVVADTSPP